MSHVSTERGLPEQYIAYLDSIETYHRKGILPNLAMVLFILFMAPIFLITLGLNKLLRDKNGVSPFWMQRAGGVLFRGVWKIHDVVGRPIFGSGEVTKTD